MATRYPLDSAPTHLQTGNSCENTDEEEYSDGPCLILKDCSLDNKAGRSGRGGTPSKFIPLNKDILTIGRSPDVDICILSNSVSRRHATLIKRPPNGVWHIIDNESVNGVYINGQKLLSSCGKESCLRNGDVIHFAPLTAPGVSYVFQLHGMLKRSASREETISKKCRLGENDAPPETTTHVFPLDKQSTKPLPIPSCNNPAPVTSDYEISPQKLSLLQKNKALEAKLSEMEKKFEECMKQKEAEMNRKIESEQARLVKEKEELERKLGESETLLKEEWNAKLAKLLSEQRTAMEEKQMMQNMLDRLKEEKNTEGEKTKLEQKLFQAELQCISLQRQLEEMKVSSTSGETVAMKLRDDLLQNFSNTVETELQCSICNELFVKAMTLTCSHSFCNYCITEWRKKKPECPMCRKPITCVAPSVVLDSFIDKVVETFTTELKERRKSLLVERQELCAKMDAAASEIPTGRQQRGRGRGQTGSPRRNMHTRSQRATVQAVLSFPRVVVEPIEISSDSSSTSEESEMDNYTSSSSVDDDVVVAGTGSYYGGYGVCFRCGHRGHWANGCPF